MKTILHSIRRLVLYFSYKKVARVITSIIDKTEGHMETLDEVPSQRLRNKHLGVLLDMYDKPPEAPASIQEKLDRYSAGQNWEYAWCKACFAVISTLDFKSKVPQLKTIVDENHIWFSNDAFGVLITLKSGLDESQYFEFVKHALNEKEPWARLSYLKSLATNQDAEKAYRLLEPLFHRALKTKTESNYLLAFYQINETITENELVQKHWAYYLKDVICSDEPAIISKYSEAFKFTPELRAKTLLFYMKLFPNDTAILNKKRKWLESEKSEEVLNILNGKIE